MGYRAWFGSAGSGAERDVTFSIYHDESGVPAKPVAKSQITRPRARDDIRGDFIYNAPSYYRFPEALELDSGVYWVTVAQLGEQGMELDASAAGMRMVTTNYSDEFPVGARGNSVLIEKRFREYNAAGELVNRNLFAYENTYGSNEWHPFTPSIGNPAYAHLDHAGSIGKDTTYSRGTWMPLIKPWFGLQTYSDPPGYENPDCTTDVEVRAPDSGAANTANTVHIGSIMPNPFSDECRVVFSLAQISPVHAEITDLHGNTVCILARATFTAGTHSLTWNGRNASGRPVAAGSYFLRLRAGTEVLVRPLLRMP